MKRILCVGDACADILIPYGTARQGGQSEPDFSCGGTVANTAAGLGRLGASCAFLGKAGRDYFGVEMQRALAADGVDTSRFTLCEDRFTPLVLICVDERGDRFPFLFPRKDPTHLALYPSDFPRTCDFDFVFTSGLMLFEAPAAPSICSFLEACVQSGVPVLLDINLRVESRTADRQYLYRAMDCASYLLGSTHDELLPLSDGNLVRLVSETRAVIARSGEKGADLLTVRGQSHCDAFPVRSVDTVGAGDCYNSGFLYALAKGYAPEFANICGCAAAAIAIQGVGARNCPTEAELLAFLQSYGIALPS